jgi:hypothetical protein
MHFDYYRWGMGLWGATAFIWLLGMLTGKRTVARQSPGSRSLQLGLTLLAYFMLFSSFRWGWLATRYLEPSDMAGAAGLVITLCRPQLRGLGSAATGA